MTIKKALIISYVFPPVGGAGVQRVTKFVKYLPEFGWDSTVLTVENPSVHEMVTHVEFDTIYHEHYCYFSCIAVDALMSRHGLCLNDVQFFPGLHGGTLRWIIEWKPNRRSS